jgi:hypothetical protein
MTNEREDSSGSGGLVWFWAMVLTPLLYILSVGPVLLAFKGKPTSTGLRTFYYPVILLHDHTAMGKPIEAYCKLWGVH